MKDGNDKPFTKCTITVVTEILMKRKECPDIAVNSVPLTMLLEMLSWFIDSHKGPFSHTNQYAGLNWQL